MSGLLYKVRLLLPAVDLHRLQLSTDEGADSNATLQTYLSEEKELSKEQRANLLLQVGHCVLSLHQNNLPHDTLTSTQVFILKNLDCAALADPTLCGKIEKKSDINSLADMYCAVLSSGRKREYSENVTAGDILCSDPHVALDIMKKMADKDYPLTIEEVMQHPFHWNDFHKVHFICEAVECLNIQYKENKQILGRYHMNNVDGIIPDEGWIAKLILTKEEIKRIRDFGPPSVPEDRIKQIADKKAKPGDEYLIYELARFFRNRYIHFREDGEDVQSCFESYPSGYLNFFTKRFPKFFIHMYNNMKTHMCKNGFLGEFAKRGIVSESLRNIQLCLKLGGEAVAKNSKSYSEDAVQENDSHSKHDFSKKSITHELSGEFFPTAQLRDKSPGTDIVQNTMAEKNTNHL